MTVSETLPEHAGMAVPHGLRRSVFAGAALLSAALHGGALLACLEWWQPTSLGAVALPTDVVSIELSASPVIEAQPQRQPEEPAPTMAAVAPVEGNADQTAERVPETPREATSSEPLQPLGDAKPNSSAIVALQGENVADPEALPAGPVKDEKTDPEPVKPEPKKDEAPEKHVKKETAEKKKHEKPEKEANRKETHIGGVTSRARSGNGSGNAHASASRGSVLSYAAYVRARVAGNKPSANGRRGTTTVSFGVTTSGHLAYASIARSSGDAALDRLAVSAVRGAAPFPQPPSGAAPSQLRFSIAFHFQ